jgi:hypothetical protein
VHQDAVMRTTVTLDDDVYAAAVQLAKTSGERLGTVLSKLARRGLAPPRPPSPKKRTRRFPIFDVAPDAPIIPAPRVQPSSMTAATSDLPLLLVVWRRAPPFWRDPAYRRH